MRLLHRSLFSFALALTLFGLAGAQGALFTVQIKASPTRAEAEEEVRQLKAKSISAYIVKSEVPGKGVFYRVRAGVFSNRDDAKRFGANLQQRGVVSEFFVTTYEKSNDEVASRPAPTGPPPTKSTAKANQPAATSGEAPVPTRPAAQKRPDVAPVNTAPDEASEPASAAANRPTTVARNNPPANSVAANSATNSAANTPTRPAPTTANNPGLSASVGEAPAATPPSGFLRFRDPKIGYSFDYPDYWTGQPLSDKEATEQRMNAGAMFSSQKDSAFISAIWNELDKANSLSNENDLIVDVILRSMSASDGISKLEETTRRVENRDGLIKTYLDLKAVFQTQEQSAPLDFLGKAVIVRANRGILLVAAFYSKDSAPNVAAAADKIIASARAPE
ncbi:MAG TPA: SPOR domain-containing protein [Blastocatellia bacterium]|nr:SPOR domain-containing protein [Blastocatellia bacterium]